jgi:hypothetical protein
VQAIHNRHQYNDEKGKALKRAAGLIDAIINPPASNGVAMWS